MKRDYEKLQKEYQRLADQGKGRLYYSDYEYVISTYGHKASLTVIKSIEIGIALGYRIAKREQSNNKID